MQQVWKKIGHADKKHIDSLIITLQIPITWPSTTSDEHSRIKLDNPKTANFGGQSTLQKKWHCT
eukprot:11587603-Ditylum_brightwellii.AAC.1